MKFKLYKCSNSVHKKPLCCLDWTNNEEVYTVSDEHQIYKWDCTTREPINVAKLPDDFFPTDFHWLLGRGSNTSKGIDSLLISSNDGRFVILNKSARVERNINAHAKAITSGRWSPDGVGLLTASEDGFIKIWSRSGMLRSNVNQGIEPIRCARWSSQATEIAFCYANFISIKPLAANSKLLKWRAHEGLVLCISWSNEKSLLASGGEEHRYKIWDTQGTNIFTSSTDDSPITSIEFNPYHDLLAIGSFNTIKLCNLTGYSYGTTRLNFPSVGSIYGISWSPDGSQIACGSSIGNLIFGYVIENELIIKNLKTTIRGRKTISLEDIVSGTTDTLEFSERIINWSLGYGHLIVATLGQIHIFSENYINTPIIVDGRQDVRIIQAGRKFFLVVDNSSIWIYSYTGRLHLNPRYRGSQAHISTLPSNCISLGQDIICVRDGSNLSTIHCFDLMTAGTNRHTEPLSIQSTSSIVEVAACRAVSVDNQYIVFIDSNRELYITFPSSNTKDDKCYKIGTQILSVMWASESNILVGLHDNCYTIWYCPGEAGMDPILISLTTITIDSMEFGRYIKIESFEESIITFFSSGIRFSVGVSIYCEALHRATSNGNWNQGLKICRLVQEISLWATLAAIATKMNQLEICEEAYAAALQIDKVSYLNYIKNLKESSTERFAETSLAMGRIIEAQTILLNNKKYTEAIKLCLRIHQWDKALEIAEKHNIELENVLIQRQKYLKALGAIETNENYLKLLQKN